MAAVVASKVKRQRQQAQQLAAGGGPSPADSQLIQRKIREARDPSLIAKRKEAEREAAYYRQDQQGGPDGVGPGGIPARGASDLHLRAARSKLEKMEANDGTYQASGSANILLYIGLGMLSIGLIITFVGLGDKGFRTLELQLIGPSLCGCGTFFCLIRILFCTCPSFFKFCCKCCSKEEEKEDLPFATNDPPPKTGYVTSKPTNMSMSATSFQEMERQRLPTADVEGLMRKKSASSIVNDGKNNNQNSKMTSEEDLVDSDDDDLNFRNGRSNRDKTAKPLSSSNDRYSSDSISQYSVDIVEIAARGLEIEDGPLSRPSQRVDRNSSIYGSEVLLNASKLNVESEKNV